MGKTKNEREMDRMSTIIIAKTVFMVNGIPLKQRKEFETLGRIMERYDNLKSARIAWGQIGRILGKERANVNSMTSMYKAIVHPVLLRGAESWVVTTGHTTLWN
jgi:hypothetical protein